MRSPRSARSATMFRVSERREWSSLQAGAIALHELFCTLREAGFSEAQALELCKTLIVNHSEADDDEGDE